MRKVLNLVAVCLVAGTLAVPAVAEAQRPAMLISGDQLRPLGEVDLLDTPSVDFRAVELEDEQRETDGLPLRFAIPNAVSVSPKSHGTWETLDTGERVWRLRVQSIGADSLNLGFGEYHMPDGGRLHLYSPELKHQIRPFTARDNAAHGELWTPIVPVDELVVEVTLPEGLERELRLKLVAVNAGYRDFGSEPSQLSGSCNVDVVCPLGDNWRNEIPATGAYSTGGSIFCTGSMVNNTSQDRTPYFLTANHCGIGSGNAASLVVYWNFETTTCGGTPNGSLSDFQTGAFHRASYSPSDFTLVELDEDPNPAWNVTFAGWDRSGTEANTAIAIHHPNGDEKRISFEYQATTTTTYLQNAVPGDGTHHRIIDWDDGTTEPGSSGSPLFNENHRVIGQLHGGYASCSSQTSDWYGKLSVSWTGGGSSSSRLSDWLDAAGTGALTVDTIGVGPLVRYESSVIDDSAGNGDGIVDPGETIVLQVSAKNAGSEPASSITGTLSTSDAQVTVVDATADWPNLSAQQEALSVAPHLSFSVDPSFGCGGLISFALDHDAAETTTGWSSGFQLQVGVQDPGEIGEYADDMEAGTNGWSTAELSGANPWAQSTTRSNSPVTSWFVADIASVSDAVLTSPTFVALAPGAKLRFQHFLNSEATYDGGVLEYTTDGSSWLDAGSLIAVGGYNATISTGYSSPIGGRSAWAGDFGGWVQVEVDLSSLAGEDVAFRWRFATDSSVTDEGWFIDDVEIVRTTFTCNPASGAAPGEASDPTGAGQPLRLQRNAVDYGVSWSAPPTGGAVDDYMLYSMPLSSVSQPASCEGDLGAGTSTSMATLSDNSAFLVVARNAVGEGTYGRTSSGAERPASPAVCP